ncbi:MAG TPA: type II CAAX endopeptidase family protein [Pyrinomonadaceae bacterium]|nr:type II CAAX endopeptidase family protein [Pyrinomonadaceae bacterium]
MSNLNDVVTPLAGLADPSSIQPAGSSQHNLRAVDANNPVWGVGGALLLWVGTFVVQAIIPLLFIIPFAIQRGLNPSSPDFGRAAIQLAVTDRTAILLQVISILPTHLLTLALLWAFVTRFGKRPFLASFGWGWSRIYGRWEPLALVALGIALFLIGATLASLLGANKPTQLEQIINSSTAARYAIAALAVFTAPFVEEFVYRGVVYSALQRVIGVNWAVVFVLGLFTLIHVPQYWPNVGVISAVALLSIVLTVVRAYSGRLLPCVVIHMAFNAVQALILIIEPYLRLPAKPPAVPTSMLLPFVRFIF